MFDPSEINSIEVINSDEIEEQSLRFHIIKITTEPEFNRIKSKSIIIRGNEN